MITAYAKRLFICGAVKCKGSVSCDLTLLIKFVCRNERLVIAEFSMTWPVMKLRARVFRRCRARLCRGSMVRITKLFAVDSFRSTPTSLLSERTTDAPSEAECARFAGGSGLPLGHDRSRPPGPARAY